MERQNPGSDRPFSEWISHWLVDQKINGTELAKRIGVSKYTVRAWKRGQTQPSKASREKMATLLKPERETGTQKNGKPKAAKRRTIPPKLRFEVFKRDSFTCQYCGKSSIESGVILHVDHINPVAKGGDNNILNLTTSCTECNFGKGARELSDNSVLAKQKRQLDNLAERRSQLDMAIEWRKGLSAIDDDSISAISAEFRRRSGFEVKDDSIIRKSQRKFGTTATLSAMDTSIDRYLRFDDKGNATIESASKALRAIFGVAKNESLPENEKTLRHALNIIMQRMSYLPEKWKIYSFLTEAVRNGAEPKDLRDMARGHDRWREFENYVKAEWEF